MSYLIVLRSWYHNVEYNEDVTEVKTYVTVYATNHITISRLIRLLSIMCVWSWSSSVDFDQWYLYKWKCYISQVKTYGTKHFIFSLLICVLNVKTFKVYKSYAILD